MSDRSDVDLVVAAQAGDRLSWELLIGRHAARLGAYLGARLRRIDVVDRLVADTVVVAWRHLHEMETPEGFPAWFRRLGANQAMRWHKQHRGESLAGEFPIERCGDDAALYEEMAQLERALGQLPEAQRMALEQRFRGGLEGTDLAEALHRDAADCPGIVEEALAMLDGLLRAQGRDGTGEVP